MTLLVIPLIAIAVLLAVWPELFTNHIAHDLGIKKKDRP